MLPALGRGAGRIEGPGRRYGRLLLGMTSVLTSLSRVAEALERVDVTAVIGCPARCLDDDWDPAYDRVVDQLGERPFAERPVADVRVTVPARAAGVRGVVRVHQAQSGPPHRLVEGGQCRVHTTHCDEIMTRGVQVAGVEADAEPGMMIEGSDVRAEFLYGRAQGLPLAGHGFQQEGGAAPRDRVEEREDVLAHLPQGCVLGAAPVPLAAPTPLVAGGARHCGTGMDHHTAGADLLAPAQRVGQGRAGPPYGFLRGRTEVHQVGGVHVGGCRCGVHVPSKRRILTGIPWGEPPPLRVGDEDLHGFRLDLDGMPDAARA